MKKSVFYLFLAAMVISFSACEERVFDSVDETSSLKKGKKQPADVQFGDLYGDLLEVEILENGVPRLYELQCLMELQDGTQPFIIDVQNPRLTGGFDLMIYRNDDGSPAESPVPAEIQIDDDGFISNYSPAVLYDLEGEILEEVTYHVIPVEQGRLNLIRSSPDVLPKRMTEVIKNFGDGTVAAVVRDYCGRFYMVRTDAALELGYEDKPIDSPLENMAIYKELMLHGFERPAEAGGLKFLVDEDKFHFQAKIDREDYYLGPYDFPPERSLETVRSIVMNLAASCIAAASDKSGELNLDEIILVNRFLGIPEPPADSKGDPTSFFDTVTQEVRMLNKTSKTVEIKYRYYIDYTSFEYHRLKFVETMVELYTSDIIDGVYVIEVEDTLTLHEILSGSPLIPLNITDVARYEEKDELFNKAVGFANQADDYVQALAVIHNNEEFLEWQMPTPTWSLEELEELEDPTHSPISRLTSPFTYVPADNEGGSGGGGNQGGSGGNGNGGRK